MLMAMKNMKSILSIYLLTLLFIYIFVNTPAKPPGIARSGSSTHIDHSSLADRKSRHQAITMKGKAVYSLLFVLAIACVARAQVEVSSPFRNPS